MVTGKSLSMWTAAEYGSGPNLTIGTWYHVALTDLPAQAPARSRSYLNGAPAIVLDGNAAIPAQRMSIANDSWHDWMNGSAAGVKIYDAVLTQAADRRRILGTVGACPNGWSQQRLRPADRRDGRR